MLETDNNDMIYYADGRKPEIAWPENGKHYQLSELQEIVGGYIELVYLSKDLVMVCNEEGKLMDFPFNYEATKLFRLATNGNDRIMGDVIVLDRSRLR